MPTCVIRTRIDPAKRVAFRRYSAAWVEAIPRCGADLMGYFAPHDGSAARAHGIHHVESLARTVLTRTRPAGRSRGARLMFR